MSMAAESKGLLLVTMEPPATLAEEFDDWYDTEHFPQRRALPGFESASRWVCLDGWPRWLALYDLASPAVLETDAYRGVSGLNATPWSRRILPRTIGRMRVIAEQVAPGTALGFEPGNVSRLFVARFPRVDAESEAAIVVEAAARSDAVKGTAQSRVFRTIAETSPDLWLITEFGRPLALGDLHERFGELGGVGADVFNLYGPYHPR